MAEPLRIDFVSDVVCPWCVVGLRSLSAALERVGAPAQIFFHPFELNPDMPREGQNTGEHVAMKYGSTPERSRQAREVIKEHGAALGFTFNYNDDSRIWNTFDAHRLLHWAAQEGKQRELKEALFKATFTDQRDVSDPAVLAEVAGEVGLDAAKAAGILSSDTFANEVRAHEEYWRQNGIQAVPSIIINQRWLLQGAQPPEIFEDALRRVLDGTAKPA